MKLKNHNIKSIEFKDFGEFTNTTADLMLVDIVNDASKEINPNDFVETPGAFVYELDLSIDTQRIHDLNVEGIKVKIYTNNPHSQPNISKSAKGEALKQQKFEIREFLYNRPSPIFETEVSLSADLAYKTTTHTAAGNFEKYTSPTSTPSLKGFVYQTPPLVPKPSLHNIFLAKKPATTGGLSAATITASPHNTYTSLNSLTSNSTSLMKDALKAGTSPINMLSTPMPVYPTIGAVNSLSIGNNFYNPVLAQAKVISLDNIIVRRSLTESRLLSKHTEEDTPTMYKLASALSGNGSLSLENKNILGYKAVIQNYKKRVRRRLEITKSLLGSRSKFYVEIVPIIQKSEKELSVITTLKGKIFSVSHNNKLVEILEPVLPPEMSLVQSTLGSVVLRVKQVDPGCSGIKIVREHSSPKSGWTSSSKAVIKTIGITNETSTYTVVDSNVQNVAPAKVSYTAISLGAGGTLGPSKVLVVQGINSPNINVTNISDTLSIIAKNEKDRVKIEVENIPDDIVAIRLYREDLSRLKNKVHKIKLPDLTTMASVEESTSQTFYDNDAQPGRPCRYFCVMRPAFGPEFTASEDEPFIRKRPTKPLPVNVILTNENLKGARGSFTFEVDIVATPRNDNIDFILKTLEKSGVSSIFLKEMEKQRSDFADLAVFIVERVNRTTGKRVSFGIQPSGTFKDSPDLRKQLQIPEIENDSRYSYYIKLCLKSPESLMKSVFAKFSNAANPGIDNQEALSQKFLSIYADQFGNSPGGALPSSAELIKGISVADNLRAGETGLVLETELRTPDAKPAPRSLTGLKLSLGNVRLMWSSSPGDLQEINTCLVFASIMGVKSCIGTVASDGSTSDFVFVDTHFGTTPGKITYTVQYVYRNLTLSGLSRPFNFLNLSYTPPALITGRYLGVI